MLEDIVGDYKEKTVTLEDFPFFDSAVKMASVHPCKHASVMKVLLDRADAALKLRKAKLKRGEGNRGKGGGVESGMEGLVDEMGSASLDGNGKGKGEGFKSGVAAAGGAGGDEWEVLEEGAEDDEVAIRVDQYLVVFLKVRKRTAPLMTKQLLLTLDCVSLWLLLHQALNMISRWVSKELMLRDWAGRRIGGSDRSTVHGLRFSNTVVCYSGVWRHT